MLSSHARKKYAWWAGAARELFKRRRWARIARESRSSREQYLCLNRIVRLLPNVCQLSCDVVLEDDKTWDAHPEICMIRYVSEDGHESCERSHAFSRNEERCLSKSRVSYWKIDHTKWLVFQWGTAFFACYASVSSLRINHFVSAHHWLCHKWSAWVTEIV